MQTIHIIVEADGSSVGIKVGVDMAGQSSAPELLAYTDIIQKVKILLYAMTGTEGVQQSIDAANDMIAFMEKVIEVRVRGDDSIVTLSGNTFFDELKSLFEEHDGDQKSACYELLNKFSSGEDVSLVDKDVINKALGEIARKIMDGTLGEEENVDAPGIPAPPIFTAN